MQKGIQPPACSFTVCIESCLPIGWRIEKIHQSAALFWFGLRNDGIFYLRAAIQRTIDVRLEHIQTVNCTSRRIGGHFAWSGSELWSCFKYSRSKIKKLKTYSGWCPFKGLSNDTTLMQIQSDRTVPLRSSRPQSFSHRNKGSTVYMPSCSFWEIFFSYSHLTSPHLTSPHTCFC